MKSLHARLVQLLDALPSLVECCDRLAADTVEDLLECRLRVDLSSDRRGDVEHAHRGLERIDVEMDELSARCWLVEHRRVRDVSIDDQDDVRLGQAGVLVHAVTERDDAAMIHRQVDDGGIGEMDRDLERLDELREQRDVGRVATDVRGDQVGTLRREESVDDGVEGCAGQTARGEDALFGASALGSTADQCDMAS